MQRAERTGLGISIAGHVAVFGALSLGLFAATRPMIPTTQPIDVQIVDQVGLTDTSPEPPKVEPAQSIAPETGTPEDATATPPDPAPAPPAPVQRDAVAPLKPAPTPKPAPKAVTKPAPAKPAVKPSVAPARGSKLGSDFLKGVSDRPSASTAQTPRAVAVGPAQQVSLNAAILRQVQPCANRIVSPGPGAERIVTRLNLRMNLDGSFAATPTVVSQDTDEDNVRYGTRVGELAKAAFVQCSPFELPVELYEGWKNIILRYRMPG